MSELKPCPRGTDMCKPYVCRWVEAKGVLVTGMAEVRCECGMRGPTAYGETAKYLNDTAAALWNMRRPTLSPETREKMREIAGKSKPGNVYEFFRSEVKKGEQALELLRTILDEMGEG